MTICDECRGCQDHCCCSQFGGPDNILDYDYVCEYCEAELILSCGEIDDTSITT